MVNGVHAGLHSNIEQSEFEKWLTQIAATLLIKVAWAPEDKTVANI